jgi:hypothetical protein
MLKSMNQEFEELLNTVVAGNVSFRKPHRCPSGMEKRAKEAIGAEEDSSPETLL